MPPTLLSARTHLPLGVRREIQALTGPRALPFLKEIVMAWGFILAVIAAAEALSSPLVTVLAIILIATRQNILGLLVHEQAHFLGFRSRTGELLANLFAGYPLFISVEGYANVHLAHHQYYFTEKDPDFLRKQGGEWSFPFRKRDLAFLFLKDILGFSTWKTMKGKRTALRFPGSRKIQTPRNVRLFYYAAFAILFSLTGTWRLFLLYWLLPLTTVLQVMVRWGALCEHKYNLLHPEVDHSTPFIKLRTWEKVLFPNLNFTYHIYHHYYPGISFSNLPKVHQIFQRERLVNELNVFRGYGMFLQYLFRRGNFHAGKIE